jgi:ABC-2 type transport system ATP-binding protein
MNASPRTLALELAGVTKDYAIGVRGFKLRALDNFSLRVPAGEAWGLAGPNGSGKSTTLKLMLGLTRPTAGACRIFGQPSELPAARQSIGYLPESPAFPAHLTGLEAVRFAGRLCGLSGAQLDRQARAMLELTGLAEAAERRTETYSKGMLQRLGLAQALVHDPAILVLDEPTAGVDLAGSTWICGLLQRLKAQGKTLVVTSHQLSQLEETCDAVVILDRGRLVFSSPMAALAGPAGGMPPLRSRLEEAYLARVGREG